MNAHDDCDHGCLLGDPRCPKAPKNMTCPTCGKVFYCPKDHEPHECFTCDYATQMKAADDRFAPLRRALESQGIKVAGVDQTGGMCMCLSIPGPGQSWVWFSEHGDLDDKAGFGAYRWAEDEGECVFADDPPIEDKVENVEAIAAWAAPRIKAFFAKQDEELTFDQCTKAGLDGTGRDFDPRFPYTWAKLTEDEWRRFDRRTSEGA